jgi:hypothetical protein
VIDPLVTTVPVAFFDNVKLAGVATVVAALAQAPPEHAAPGVAGDALPSVLTAA